MHIVSREQWEDPKVDFRPPDTGKLADLCDAINEILKNHPSSESLLVEEINIDIDNELWPTLEECRKLTELIEEAGFEYISIMCFEPEYFTLRIGVRSEHLGLNSGSEDSFRNILNIIYKEPAKNPCGYGDEGAPPF